jgi:hypothetical protein
LVKDEWGSTVDIYNTGFNIKRYTGSLALPPLVIEKLREAEV